MKKRLIFVWIMYVIVLSLFVNSLTQNQFTNGLTEENLTYTEKDTIVRYILLPRYIDVINATLNISLFNNSLDFNDSFNRANGVVGNGWIDNSVLGGSVDIENNLMLLSNLGGARKSIIYRNSSVIPTDISVYNYSFIFNITGILNSETYFYSQFFYGTSNNELDNGLTVLIETFPTYNISIRNKQVELVIKNLTLQLNVSYNMNVIYNNTAINVKIWEVNKTEPTNFNISYNINLSEITSTPDREYFMIAATGPSSSTVRVDDFNLHYDNKIDFNVSVGIGTKNIFNFTEPFNYTKKIDFTTYLNSLAIDCSCNNCTSSINSCIFPTFFQSDTKGVIKYKNLNISYILLNTTLNVTLIDSDTLQPIRNVNITTQIVSSQVQKQDISDLGESIFLLNFTTLGKHNISIRSFENDTSDYSIVIREVEVTQGVNQSVIMYLTNTSDTTKTQVTTMTVEDISTGNLVENAIIHVFKQVPSTGQLIPLSDLTTNSNGEASMLLQLDTIFYQFTVEFKGDTVYSSSVFPITSATTELFFPIDLSTRALIFYNSLFDVDASVSWINQSNTTGHFNLTYTSEETYNLCLDVSIANLTGIYLQEQICNYNVSSGSFISSTITSENLTLYLAQAKADFSDSFGYREIANLIQYVGLDNKIRLGVEGLIFLIFIIVLALFGFVDSPLTGMIMLGVGFTVVFMFKLSGITGEGVLLSPLVYGLIMSIIIFSIFTYARRK